MTIGTIDGDTSAMRRLSGCGPRMTCMAGCREEGSRRGGLHGSGRRSRRHVDGREDTVDLGYNASRGCGFAVRLRRTANHGCVKGDPMESALDVSFRYARAALDGLRKSGSVV